MENEGKINGFLMREKKNILDILSNSRKAIKSKDSLKLKELSNHVIHSASVYQDSDSIMLAVLMYSLSKIIERSGYIPSQNWKFFERACADNLSKAETAVKKENPEEFRNYLINLRQEIITLSGPMNRYIEDVFRRAMINKASRLYEHGISMSKTSELLGISAWELAEYAGKTGIADVDVSITQNIRTRISKALKFFE